MYIHFEDWSAPIFIDQLEAKGLPHSDKIIKAFATDIDPREVLDRPQLTVVESRDEVFTETYDYPGRGTYTGQSLELALASLEVNDLGNRIIRSLFRFANEGGYTQAAMAAEKDGDWLIWHPFEDIDGIDVARNNPNRTYGIHLDIFFPESMRALKQTVDYDYDENVLHWRDSPKLHRTL